LQLRDALAKVRRDETEGGMALYPDYPVLTERLRLRPFTRGDVDAVFVYRQREDVARYLFDVPLSREECALAVQQRTGQVALESTDDKIILAVDALATGELIGEVSLIWRSVETRQCELGWIFDPRHHGHGYATEAAGALLDLAFGPGDMHRAFARCDARNLASSRLMERLGMRREAHFREHMIFKGEWNEEFIYAVLRREWRSRHEAATASSSRP
jgi:RimJ/RimL family protein N-acetyltransferase